MKFKLQNPLQNKKGSMIMETLPVLALALFVTINMIGWFTYLTPRQNLEKQVHILAQKAKIQGGLTDKSSVSIGSDLEVFLGILEEKGYDTSKVKITCTTNPGNKSCLGVSPIKSSSGKYITRESLDMMIIRVEIPTNPRLLNMSQTFFGNTGALPNVYIFQESVLSERW